MFRSTSSFDRLLERATSNLLLEPDWNAILQICDSIRSGDTNAKYAITAIKKKFYHENPHVVLYALTVLESCVKNCGSLIHEEIATRAFMEELRELLKHTNDENTKQKILEMLQTWGMAFRNSPRYRIATETLNLMKAEGWKFPAVREAEAMFEADTAPEWAEGDVCNRCRVAFGMMTRQHHCRACGQVFCNKCSSKFCPLPKFGIEREVRVCDPCFDQYGPKEQDSPRPHQPSKKKLESDLPEEYLASALSQQSQAPPPRISGNGGKSEAEIKEEEELQLAIALSQSEAEEKEKSKHRSASALFQSSPTSSQQTKTIAPEELDPELVRYLDRGYWEEKEKEKAEERAKPVSSAASSSVAEKLPAVSIKPTSPSKIMVRSKTVGNNDEELDEFVTTLKTQLEIFVNRMKSNSSRGRSITNDSSVQTLFMNTMAMHSKLLKHIQDQEDQRVHYEGLQDKLAQVKDARAALDALREEERERKRREAEEVERQRQLQMREKLELMRQKKTEYLQYQRQLAMQRMQEQEREMMLRQEQSRQQYVQQQAMYPGMYNPYFNPAAPQQAPPGTGYPNPQFPQAGMMPPPPPSTSSGSEANFNMSAIAGSLPPQAQHFQAPPQSSMVPSMMPPPPSQPALQVDPNQPPQIQQAPLQQPPLPPVHPAQQAQSSKSNSDALAELISFD